MKKFVIISIALVLVAAIVFGVALFHYMKVKEPEKKEEIHSSN